MSVASTVYGELTQPFRYSDQQDSAVLTAYPLARSVEAITAVSNISDLEALALERFGLLKVPRRRFLVTVEGPDYLAASDFAGSAPAAILKCKRWGLAAGRKVLIVKFESDYAANVTRLLVWG